MYMHFVCDALCFDLAVTAGFTYAAVHLPMILVADQSYSTCYCCLWLRNREGNELMDFLTLTLTLTFTHLPDPSQVSHNLTVFIF